jgi:streptogramin lyase
MTAGADGHVWFVKDGSGGPGGRQIDPATGACTTFSSGLNGAFTLFGGIALGGDGNVWFTSYFDGLIGRVTPAGDDHRVHRGRAEHAAQRDHRGPQIAGSNTLWVTDPTEQVDRQADALASRRRSRPLEVALHVDAERAFAQPHDDAIVAAEAHAQTRLKEHAATAPASTRFRPC